MDSLTAYTMLGLALHKITYFNDETGHYIYLLTYIYFYSPVASLIRFAF